MENIGTMSTSELLVLHTNAMREDNEKAHSTSDDIIVEIAKRFLRLADDFPHLKEYAENCKIILQQREENQNNWWWA